MPFSEKLSNLSNDAIKRRLDVRQKREQAKLVREKQKAALEAKRIEEARIRAEIQDSLSKKLLLLSYAGKQFLVIDNPTEDDLGAVRDGPFTNSVPADALNRAKKIVSILIPRRLAVIQAEFLQLEEDIERDLSGLNALAANALSSNMDDLPFRIESISEALADLYWRNTKFLESRRSLLKKFDSYFYFLRPALPRILSAQQAFLGRVASMKARNGEDLLPTGAGVAEAHLRKLLEAAIPSQRWDENSLTKAELQIMFAAVANDWTLARAVQEHLAQHPANQRLEILQLLQSDDHELPDPRAVFDTKKRVDKICKEIKGLCRELAELLNGFDVQQSVTIGSDLCFPAIVSLSFRHVYHGSAEFMRSSIGQINAAHLQSDLEGRADKGHKNIVYDIDYVTSGFTLQKKGGEIMIFAGDLDHYLYVWNHSEGLGLGYEVVTKQNGKQSLKLYWE